MDETRHAQLLEKLYLVKDAAARPFRIPRPSVGRTAGAAGKSLGGSLKSLARFGGAAMLLAAGLKGGEALYDKFHKPLQKKKYYNAMAAEHPDIVKDHPEDSKKFFNTLYTFNPTMASDPLAAGSFLRRALQYKSEGVQPNDLKTLTDINKNLHGGKSGNDVKELFSLAKGLSDLG